MEKNYSQGHVFSSEILTILEDLRSADLNKIDRAIAKLNTLESAPLLDTISRALNDNDPHTRCSAIELLCIMGLEKNLEAALPLLEDPIDSVRLNLLNCFIDCKLSDPRTVEPLINVLLNDSDSDVRSLAAIVLGNLGDPRAKSALQWIAEHDMSVDYEGVAVSEIAQRALEKINQR